METRYARLIGLLAASAVMLAAACGGGSNKPSPPASTVESQLTATSTPINATATATVTETPEPTATSTPVPVRATSYADLKYTVTNVVQSHETWRTYGGSSKPEQSKDSFLYVHLNVTNRLTRVPLMLKSSLFHLKTGSQQIDALQLWSQPASEVVNPGATVGYIMGFKITDGFDLAGAQLIIAESGKVPASVLLQGPPAASAYPIEAPVGDEASPINTGSGCNDLTADPRLAVVDVDAGIDASGISGEVDGGRRAQQGERFLRFDMRVTAHAHDCALSTDFFRLKVDGQTIDAANHLVTTVKAGKTLDFRLVYRIPVGAKQITLLAGAVKGSEKPFPITVSDFGP